MPPDTSNVFVPNVDPYRPKLHFAPRKGWVNDPNGLVHLDGEYHLFFQHNPNAPKWGNIGWGHAVSRDLLTWEELPMALPAQEDHMIFSGSCVVDHTNSLGLVAQDAATLVACYTAHYPNYDGQGVLQRQHLAYSQDRGRSWTHHSANPVLDLHHANFRDPKVFWHVPSMAWIMVVVFAMDRQVGIFRSPDLVHWQEASRFGPAGFQSGQWECPDLFEAPIEGSIGTKWILKVDIDRDTVGPFSGAQMFLGNFDGAVFTPDLESAGSLVDYGPDFYAAQTIANIPGCEPIWLAWCANHQMAHDYPTKGWQGCMTLPRKITLRKTDDGHHLRQSPLMPETPASSIDALGDISVQADQDRLIAATAASEAWRLSFDAPNNAAWAVNISSRCGSVKIGGDLSSRYFVDVRDAPEICPDGYRRVYNGEQPVDGKISTVEIIWDATTLEVFVGGGAAVWTSRVFLTGEIQIFLKSQSEGCLLKEVRFNLLSAN